MDRKKEKNLQYSTQTSEHKSGSRKSAWMGILWRAGEELLLTMRFMEAAHLFVCRAEFKKKKMIIMVVVVVVLVMLLVVVLKLVLVMLVV